MRKSTTGGQRIPVDLDQLDRVLGHVPALGQHERHLVADEAGLALGERGQRGRRRLRAEHGEPLLVHVGVQVGGGEDGVHAVERERGSGVDATDRGTRVRAAHEAGVQHPRPGDVVDEGALPGQQAGVLDPGDALPA